GTPGTARRVALDAVGPGAPAAAWAHRPGAPESAAAATPAGGHGGERRAHRVLVHAAGVAEPGPSAGQRRCARRAGATGPGRQAVRALRPAVRRAAAAGRHRPGALPVAATDPGRRTGLGHGPGAGRAYPGAAQPRGGAARHQPAGQRARGGTGPGAFSAHRRGTGWSHPVRSPRRRGERRRAAGAVRQCATAAVPRAGHGAATAHAALLMNTVPRDPAALPRLLLTLLALALLWPGLSLSELDLTALFRPDNASVMGGFLAGFWPPAHDASFLQLLWQATLETLAIATAGLRSPAHEASFLQLLWQAALETLAIATAGMRLALLIAMPCALLASRALSLSALPRGGRPAWWAQALRWPVRGLLIVLRSVPE